MYDDVRSGIGVRWGGWWFEMGVKLKKRLVVNGKLW